jgi:hypothetical protein
MYDNIHFFLHPDILHHKQVVNISLQYTFLTPCTLILHYPALHLLSLFQDSSITSESPPPSTTTIGSTSTTAEPAFIWKNEDVKQICECGERAGVTTERKEEQELPPTSFGINTLCKNLVETGVSLNYYSHVCGKKVLQMVIQN